MSKEKIKLEDYTYESLNRLSGTTKVLTPATSPYGIIASVIPQNIARRKEPDLFSLIEEEDVEGFKKADLDNYVDRKGNPINLTNLQGRALMALAYVISQDREAEDIKNCIDSSKKLQVSDIGNIEAPKTYTSVSRWINLIELSRIVFGRSREIELKKIEEVVSALADVFKNVTPTIKIDKAEYSIKSPLIVLKDRLNKHFSEVRSTRGRKTTTQDKDILVGIVVEFSPLFFHKLDKDYCPITPKLFEVCRSKGNGTETDLFFILLNDIMGKWKQKLSGAMKAIKGINDAHPKMGIGNKMKLVKEAKNRIIYETRTYTIKERLTTKYQRESRFLTDLQRAIDRLIEIGIITEESYITQKKDKVIFILNPDYGSKKDTLLEG